MLLRLPWNTPRARISRHAFFTREERAIELEEYAGELKKELTAVEEQIKELKR